MPLLNGQPWQPSAPLPPEAAPEEEVFYLKLTGEVFGDYETYLNRLAQLRCRQFSCVHTGKTNLSYEQALREEEKARSLAAKVCVACTFVVCCLSVMLPLQLASFTSSIKQRCNCRLPP